MNRESNAKGEENRKRIRAFIVSYITEHGYAPSVREIGQGVGLRSSSSVQVHLDKMVELGLLETDAPRGTPRAIRIPGYKFVKE